MAQPQDLHVGQRGLAGPRHALQGARRKQEAAAVAEFDDHAPRAAVIARARRPRFVARKPPTARQGAVDLLVYFGLGPSACHALTPLLRRSRARDAKREAA